jgi:hypothetical protein
MTWRKEWEERKSVKLSDLTFRQYMALTLIFSKFSVKKTYPTKEEIKK